MSSQVMKIGSIVLSPSESLAIKSGPLNIPIIANRSLSARKVWYAIFFSGEGVTIKVPMENGKKHHRKALQRHSTGEAEKYYQKHALSLVLNISVFYMAMSLLLLPK